MAGSGAGDKKDSWVCPNDRQLALRAKLRSGWSVKTQRTSSFAKQDTLSEQEQETIIKVIQQAEQLESCEQQRVGRLVERLENMTKNALGDGYTHCILCGDPFGLLSSSNVICRDCQKAVCQKCGVDTVTSRQEPLWLCKLCAERREMWKKSGAWFFKSLPRYVLPEKKPQGSCKYPNRRLLPSSTTASAGWAKSAASGPPSEQEDSSSDEDKRSFGRVRIWSAPAYKEEQGLCPKPRLGSLSPSPQSSLSDADAKSAAASSPRRLESQSTNESVFGEDPSDSEKPAAVTKSRPPSSDTLEAPSRRGTWSSKAFADFRSPIETTVTTTTSNNNTSPNNHVSRYRGFLTRRESSIATDSSNEDSKATEGMRTLRIANWGRKRESTPSLSPSPGPGGDKSPSPSIRSMEVSPASSRQSSEEDHGAPQQDASLGMIEFSLLYDAAVQALNCTILRARRLRGMDIDGLSDPYCILELGVAGNKETRLRTTTVRKTVSPEFNETITYYGVSDNDVARKSLRLVLADEDRFGSEPMGETRVTLNKLRPNQTKHFQMFLEKPLLVSRDIVDMGFFRGEILVTLNYSTSKNVLIVGVIRCKDLPAMDSNGFSDPYVKVQLKPDSHNRRRQKTCVKWKTLAPEFNEQFVFDVRRADLPKQWLELTVWDKDFGRSNDYIGCVQLGSKSKGERLKQWLDAMKFPDKTHEHWHILCHTVISQP